MRWQEVVPQLAGIDVAGFLEQAREVKLPAQATEFYQGDRCRHYVMDGGTKALTRALNDRVTVLYRLGPGVSGMLTTACLFANTRYPAGGVIETAVTAPTIPATVFRHDLQDSVAFRGFVFQFFSAHLASVISLVEEVASDRLDRRLAR